jgi:Rab-GTPase-TBC domain
MYDPVMGYTQGLNFIAGFIIMSCPKLREEDCFVLLVRLLNHPRYKMRDLYLPGLPAVGVNSLVLEELLKEHLPALATHLQKVSVPPMFFFEWYFTLFTLILPSPLAADCWTYFFADGWISIYKLMLALLEHASPYILGKDFHGTIEGLKAYQQRRTSLEFPELNAAREKKKGGKRKAVRAGGADGSLPDANEHAKPPPSSNAGSSSSASLLSDLAPVEAATVAVKWLGDKLPSFITSSLANVLGAPPPSSSSVPPSPAASSSSLSSPSSLGIGPALPLSSPAASGDAAADTTSSAPTRASTSDSKPAERDRVINALQGANAATAAKEWKGPSVGDSRERETAEETSSAASAPGPALSSSASSSGESAVATAGAGAGAGSESGGGSEAGDQGSWVHVDEVVLKEGDQVENEYEGEEEAGEREEDIFRPLELDPPPDLVRRAKNIPISHARLEELIINARQQVAREKKQQEDAEVLRAAASASAAVTAHPTKATTATATTAKDGDSTSTAAASKH